MLPPNLRTIELGGDTVVHCMTCARRLSIPSPICITLPPLDLSGNPKAMATPLRTLLVHYGGSSRRPHHLRIKLECTILSSLYLVRRMHKNDRISRQIHSEIRFDSGGVRQKKTLPRHGMNSPSENLCDGLDLNILRELSIIETSSRAPWTKSHWIASFAEAQKVTRLYLHSQDLLPVFALIEALTDPVADLFPALGNLRISWVDSMPTLAEGEQNEAELQEILVECFAQRRERGQPLDTLKLPTCLSSLADRLKDLVRNVSFFSAYEPVDIPFRVRWTKDELRFVENG